MEIATAAVPAFYRDAGQNITKWIAPPPKAKSDGSKEQDDSFGDIESDQTVVGSVTSAPAGDVGDSGVEATAQPQS